MVARTGLSLDEDDILPDKSWIQVLPHVGLIDRGVCESPKS